jgi:hypothetical protein
MRSTRAFRNGSAEVNSRVRMRAMPSQNSRKFSFGARMALHHAHGPDSIKIFGPGGFHSWVELRNHGDGAVFSEGLHQRHRGRPAHRDGQHRARKNHRVAYGEHGELFQRLGNRHGWFDWCFVGGHVGCHFGSKGHIAVVV